MSFVRSFQRSFEDTTRIGARQFELDKLATLEDEQEKAKLEAKVKEDERSQDALRRLGGYNQNTGVPNEISTIEGQETQEPLPLSDMEKAELYSTLSTEDRLAYDKFLKPKSLMDKYTHIDGSGFYDPEKGEYWATGINKETGMVEKISPNPYAKPKTKDTFVIEGVQEIDGVSYGTRGEVTRIKMYDNGKIDSYILKDVKKKNPDKPLDQIKYEYDIADAETEAIDLKNKYNIWLTKDFKGNDNARSNWLAGINSKMNQLAFKVAKLGNKETKAKITEIINQGKTVLGGSVGSLPKITSTQFSKTQTDKLTAQFEAGEFGTGDEAFNQFQIMTKFIDYKYNNFFEYSQPQYNQDEFGLDNMSLEEEEE